jgi:ectoine hydroxylase-related dioxygenase (phytanoyl-CoA dioxygenase family)
METATSTESARPTDAQIQQYRDEGYLVLRDFFRAEEIAELAGEAGRLFARTELIDKNNIRCRWQNHVETDECRFDCFDPVIDIGPVCARIARDPRILETVGALYGEPACLFKDKLIFKPPGASGYALHQDYISWASFPKSFLTLIVAIDPADASNGATEVFPGRHKSGNLSANDGKYHELPADAVDLSTGVSLDLRPGDIGIFSGYTPHRSGPNKSGQWRRLLYLSYNALSDGGEQRDAHYAEFKQWLQERYAEYGKTNTYFR